MATVYFAHDIRHDREVALKVLHNDIADTLGRERFVREIRVAARLAHRHDVVHRDIKPENILLHEGHALVADFGIGKAIVAASSHATSLTQVGVTVGTPAHMSPAQAAGESVDGRSDLFSLGCVLYEMLTGEVAFRGSSVPATIAKRFIHTPPAITEQRMDVSPLISGIVSRLLEKEPGDRHSSGADVARDLRTPSGAITAQTRTAQPRTEIADNTIAVLPFVNMSTDVENEYFSDGLTTINAGPRSTVERWRMCSTCRSVCRARLSARLVFHSHPKKTVVLHVAAAWSTQC